MSDMTAHTSDRNNIKEMIIMNKTKKKRKKSRKPFTTGELNLVVDAVVHLLCRLNRGFRVLDVTLHGLIEKDLVKTAHKFRGKNNIQNSKTAHQTPTKDPAKDSSTLLGVLKT